MRYLFNKGNGAPDNFKGRHIFLFLDFDGTLVPIARTPDRVVTPFGIKGLLKKLAGGPYCKVAVISGRGLDDLKKRLGLSGIIYSGNHGLEIEGPGAKVIRRVSGSYRSALKQMKYALIEGLSSIRGVLIEDKGLSISLHYRMVSKKDIPGVEAVFRKIADPRLKKGLIDVLFGKKVFEVRPASRWDKGKVVLWLLKRYARPLKGGKVLPIYIGDDTTDEDAFRALQGKGLTIRVGARGASCARYYLRDVDEVSAFLRMIAAGARG
ncbi:MAG: trehalose-phosphatase [Candidatus Omnitrophica bacterium]|nr:trehalose-phosphatase [Candidatus Omnitrophota bacterium]